MGVVLLTRCPHDTFLSNIEELGQKPVLKAYNSVSTLLIERLELGETATYRASQEQSFYCPNPTSIAIHTYILSAVHRCLC